MRFCFAELIQQSLDRMVQEWNQHHLQTSRGSDCPNAKPDVMFSMPELFGGVNYTCDVAMDNIQAVRQELSQEPYPRACLPAVYSILKGIMDDSNKNFPSTTCEALALFTWFLEIIDEDLQSVIIQ